MDVLFPDAVSADQEHVDQAKRFVDALDAPAAPRWCGDACGASRPRLSDGNYVRQVVFLTDGAIGNEQQLFDPITAMRGRSRVFMIASARRRTPT